MKTPMLPLEPTKRAWLTSVGLSDEGDVETRRRAAAAIAKRCAWIGWTKGVETVAGIRTQDRVDLFKIMCEGRNGKGYWGCSDTVNFLLASLGLRDERIINRDDDNLDGVPDEKQVEANDDPGKNHWRVSQSVTMLIQGSKTVGAWVPATQTGPLPQMGDWFQIGDNGGEHVGIFVSYFRPITSDEDGEAGWYVDTVEGGQVDAGGACVVPYTEIIRLRKDGTLWMSRDPKVLGKRLYGWGNIEVYDLLAPAQVPVSFEGGREV
jgi:hypothetical protein